MAMNARGCFGSRLVGNSIPFFAVTDALINLNQQGPITMFSNPTPTGAQNTTKNISAVTQNGIQLSHNRHAVYDWDPAITM